jgi:hypothetical protein
VVRNPAVYRCSSKLFSSCVLRKDEWSISYSIKAGYVHVRVVQQSHLTSLRTKGILV